jgi:hypothetical protein
VGIPRRGERLTDLLRPPQSSVFRYPTFVGAWSPQFCAARKTSTTGLLSDYEREDEPLPEFRERFRHVSRSSADVSPS